MRAKRITTNLRVADVDAAKSFYTGYLGLSTEEFNLGWVARYTCPETGAHIQLVTRDATAPEDSVISVHTDDVDGAYETDTPNATDENRRWAEVLVAAALQGAIFAVVKAAVDRGGATGVKRLTGKWPA